MLRPLYLVAGLVLCLMGVGVVFYQLSESCEASALASAYQGYPWCSDVLDHINLTFVGVVALLLGVVILGLGGPLHWLLEPSRGADNQESPEPQGRETADERGA